jgi:hypothetical protein
MERREKCMGPGCKVIFETKAEATAELRSISEGRKARPGQGMVYRCSWGDHFHITSRGRSKRR